jgi:hypothetical protein
MMKNNSIKLTSLCENDSASFKIENQKIMDDSLVEHKKPNILELLERTKM